MSENNSSLAVQYYPCKQQPQAENIVLLHGWGTSSQTWQPLIPALQNIANIITLDLPGFGASPEISEFTLDAVINLIAAHLPQKSVLMGWSLGGMLAVQLAARYPQQISRLITLAANVKFVADRNYETAMPLSVNQQFNKFFAADSQTALKLFSGLSVQGDANERALLKQIRTPLAADKINANWQQALALLARLDNRDTFAQLTQSGLHLLAEKDSLVPISAAAALRQLNSRQSVQVIADAAHALHWSQPEFVVQTIQNFMQSSTLDKKQVAHSFSRAAATYDSVANLQRTVGDALLQKLEVNAAAQVVLDLGCGTGYVTPKLQARFPQAVVIGVDIAEGMLQFAKAKWAQGHEMKSDLGAVPHAVLNGSGRILADPIFACADAEVLPFADQSVDIIFSNFALQWCENLSPLFAELHRILKPTGQLIFTSLGPATLHELKFAWQQVDDRVHVNQFHAQDVLLKTLSEKKFVDLVFEHKPALMQFEHLSDLTRSLKALGAKNVNRGRAVGLTGRKKIQAFKRAYENLRSNNLLPATYDVFYLQAKKS